MKYLGERKEAEIVLKEEKIGRLGMFSQNYPYIVPVCYVYEKGIIYLHSGLGGHKLDCIAINNRVCFQVDQVLNIRVSDSACNYSFDYRSVIVFGEAEEVHDSEMKMIALKLLSQKYIGSNKVKKINNENLQGVVVIKISIEEITVKINEITHSV